MQKKEPRSFSPTGSSNNKINRSDDTGTDINTYGTFNT
jgi:hypothetical protein